MLKAVQKHPNIVGFRGVFRRESQESTLWPSSAQDAIMMDYCSGGDLFAALQKDRHSFTEERAAGIMRGLLSALAHVHARGIVHRDVKVENVLLAGSRPVLADFGLAAWKSDRAQMMRRCGSPGYAAPEILRQKQYNEKVDTFAAGVVLYAIFHGRTPFDGKSVSDELSRTVRCVVKFDDDVVLSNDCKRFVLHLIRRKVRERFSAKEALSHRWLARSCLQIGPSSLGRLEDRACRFDTVSNSSDSSDSDESDWSWQGSSNDELRLPCKGLDCGAHRLTWQRCIQCILPRSRVKQALLPLTASKILGRREGGPKFMAKS